MNNLIEEYGKIIITCLCVSVFLMLFHMLMFDEHTSIKMIYKTDMVDADAYDVVGVLTSDFEGSPHFEAVAMETDADKYKILNDTFTLDDALAITKIYKSDGTEYSKAELENVLTILVYRYDLVLTYQDENGNILSNPAAVYEEVNATDKYGNVIYNDDGTPKKVSVLKYNKSTLSNLTAATPIVLSEADLSGTIPPRYKLVYRVQDGQKKAEFSTLIIKE